MKLALTLPQWKPRRSVQEPGPVVLTLRRVYIIPTRHGIVFAVSLITMLLGSINYTLSLGYALTFLLASLGVVAMLHTFRNLAHLSIRAGRVSPVFAGESAEFHIGLDNAGGVERLAVGLKRGASSPLFYDVPAEGVVFGKIQSLAAKRGLLALGRFQVFTRYPLGLFHAWSNIDLPMKCLVYPRPDEARLPLPVLTDSLGEGRQYGRGTDDFAGLRPHQASDSPRHVAWKAAARDQGLLTKYFTSRANSELWLSWDDLPAQMGVEARLSRLTRWVLDSHAAGFSYGLRLPGQTLRPGQGEQHYSRCLAALALFSLAD